MIAWTSARRASGLEPAHRVIFNGPTEEISRRAEALERQACAGRVDRQQAGQVDLGCGLRTGRTGGDGRDVSRHGERRCSGRKKLTQDLENLPPGAPLAFNLRDPGYVDLLCGALERLPAAFAALDAEARTREFDGLQIETTPALFASPTSVETASLPKRDRNLVRSEGLQCRIRAAPSSRAPRTSGRDA